MSLSEILSLDILGKNIMIIGFPATGKTWLSDKISKHTHKLIHTDIFKSFGYEEGMYYALKAALSSEKNTIVEGIFGYRMLRKGAQMKTYFPDIVIEMKISNSKMVKTYLKERDEKKIKHLRQFNDNLNKVLNDYRAICPEEKKPIWIEFLNNY